MKNGVLILFLLISSYNISKAFDNSFDEYFDKKQEIIRQIVDLKSKSNSSKNSSKQLLDSLENELSFLMQLTVNYVNSKNSASIPIFENMVSGNRDIQFFNMSTENVVTNYVMPNGDTNSVLVAWQNGLPVSGTKFSGVYHNAAPVLGSFNYLSGTNVYHSGGWFAFTPPVLESDSLRFRNVDVWRVICVDVCSGNTVIDTQLPGSNNYFESFADIVGGQTMTIKILEFDEPDKTINVSNLPPSLYFVVITELSGKVINIKTLNRNLVVID